MEEHERQELAEILREVLARLDRGGLDLPSEAPPERKRPTLRVIRGGKALGITAGLAAAGRYLREHGAAAGTAAAITASAAALYGIASGPDRSAEQTIDTAPPPGVLPPATVAPATAPVDPTPTKVEPTTGAVARPASAVPAPTITAETTTPAGTPRPTPTSTPAPNPSPTDLPTATTWPTPSADPEPTPSATPSTTAPTSMPEPTPTPSATPTPGPGEPPDPGAGVCLRIRPILWLCLGR